MNYSKQINEIAPWVGSVPHHYEGQLAIARYIQRNTETPTPHICDIGSGNGITIETTQTLNPQASFESVDLPGTHNLESLLEKGISISSVESSLEELTLDKSKYDAISASLTLHHLGSQDRERVYQMLYESLKPGGTIAIFDIIEVNPHVEKAFLNYYIKNNKLSPAKARKRYLNVVGPQQLRNYIIPDNVKDQYEDKHLREDTLRELLIQSGFEKLEITQWYEGRHSEKSIFIGAKKPNILTNEIAL